jgi:uncharacterized protein YqcC (DUF446 family)
MTSLDNDVLACLIDVEAEMRNLSCWGSVPPPAQALRSEQPFAVDTLNLMQWLQFIFIPKMRFLIEQQQELPGACGIAPMAEEYFRGQRLAVKGLLAALQRMDALLSGKIPS